MIYVSKKNFLSCFLFVALTTFFSARASICESMENEYNKLEYHADDKVIKGSSFSVSPHIMGRSEHEACAIVSFFIDKNGVAHDINVISYFPRAGVGESAKLHVEGVKFSDNAIPYKKYVLYVYYNKFSMVDD